MENNNVLAPTEEQVTNVAPVEETTDVTVVDEETSEHKVLFFIIMGVLCLCGVGVPLGIVYILKLRKKNRQLQEQLDAKNAPAADVQDPAPVEEPKAEDSKETK